MADGGHPASGCIISIGLNYPSAHGLAYDTDLASTEGKIHFLWRDIESFSPKGRDLKPKAPHVDLGSLFVELCLGDIIEAGALG